VPHTKNHVDCAIFAGLLQIIASLKISLSMDETNCIPVATAIGDAVVLIYFLLIVFECRVVMQFT